MELKLAFLGFGKVARAFARLLSEKRPQLAAQLSLRWRTTAIATANHGCIFSAVDLDLDEAARCVSQDYSLLGLWRTFDASNALHVVDNCDADVIFDTTPLNPINGEPSVTMIKRSLSRGINVVTANKGPVAFAYHELKALAIHRSVSFRFEGTVMDGAPVFNLAEYCLPGTTVRGFYGIINSTTNFILSGMEEGRSFEDCLGQAKQLGIAEADPGHDIDGWDATVKAVALANVLMGADARARDVERRGIRNLGGDETLAAANEGFAVRLVARAEMVAGQQLVIRVGPERHPRESLLGATRGTSNVLVLQTDLMGEVAIVESDPGIDQTAYALLSDLIRVHEDMLRGRRKRPQNRKDLN
jgi:homoserine dehydrogenase